MAVGAVNFQEINTSCPIFDVSKSVVMTHFGAAVCRPDQMDFNMLLPFLLAQKSVKHDASV